MNALLVVCPHLSHHFEQIFRVTVIAALALNSCDTSSLRCDDLIGPCNVCGGESEFLHEVMTRGHNYSRGYAIRAQPAHSHKRAPRRPDDDVELYLLRKCLPRSLARRSDLR